MLRALQLSPIGVVSSPVRTPTDEGWGEIVSRVVLEPTYVGGLDGLEGFSHALIVTWLHGAAYEGARHLRRRPRGLASMPEVGIFAQRAKDRPNPIGVTAVEIVAVSADALTVRGLDAIDGTPVLDVKPHFPQYDRVDGARVPAWVDRLMAGYF
jgi:tRNA-Thr(GGU) m(6)t(6)A37 methyltransferase TsaA